MVVSAYAKQVVLPMIPSRCIISKYEPQCTPPLLAPSHLMQTAKPMEARKHSDLIYLDGPLTADAILKCIQQRFLEQKSVVRV